MVCRTTARHHDLCASAAGQSGALPAVLLTQQTNAQNQVGGPFLNIASDAAGGWAGSGTSYKYTTTAAGTFVICGTGDSTGADSQRRRAHRLPLRNGQS